MIDYLLPANYNIFRMIYRHPEPFAVLARPRSRVMEELIRSVEDEFPWTDADAEHLSHIDWKKGCNWSKT